MNSVRKGNLVLETELAPQARDQLINTLLRIYRSHTPEQLLSLVSRPKPLILIREVEETKSAKLVETLRSRGVPIRFVPDSPDPDAVTASNPPGPSQSPLPDSRGGQAADSTLPAGMPPGTPSPSNTSPSNRFSSETNAGPAQPPDVYRESPTDSLRPSRTIAGLWRRLAAFLIDIVVLTVIGFFLGLFFSESFIRMGSLGRLIGFAIALAYFGTQNSAVFGGQTIGKRFLDIKVVGRRGNPISLPRSTARATVLILPYFLNGLYFPYIQMPDTLSLVISLFLMLTIFGAGLSIIYLFLFNRRTRQSLHDILLKTFVVVKKAEEVVPRRAIWPAHYAVTACLLVASVTLPYLLIGNADLEPGITVLYENLQQTGKYTFVEVVDAKHWMGGVHSTSIDVKVWMKEKPETFSAAAETIATKVFSIFPEVEARDYLAVSVSRGFDIGIWGVSRTESFNLTPERWRKQLGDRVPSIISL